VDSNEVQLEMQQWISTEEATTISKQDRRQETFAKVSCLRSCFEIVVASSVEIHCCNFELDFVLTDVSIHLVLLISLGCFPLFLQHGPSSANYLFFPTPTGRFLCA